MVVECQNVADTIGWSITYLRFRIPGGLTEGNPYVGAVLIDVSEHIFFFRVNYRAKFQNAPATPL